MQLNRLILIAVRLGVLASSIGLLVYLAFWNWNDYAVLALLGIIAMMTFAVSRIEKKIREDVK